MSTNTRVPAGFNRFAQRPTAAFALATFTTVWFEKCDAGHIFIRAQHVTDLERGAQAIELEYAGCRHANRLRVAASRSLHRDAGENVVK